jgi:NAD(P)-dependent dehydrogenase (short-subunit alcohol dehydrogenase family)
MKTEELFDVRGLATIVTGGASGIGLACAEAMADNGARVTVMDIDPARLAAAVDRLRAAGGDVRGTVADVTDRTGLHRAFDETAEHYGRLDVVFANAGIGGGPGFLALDGERNPAGAIESITEDAWDRVLAMDLTSVFTTIRAAVRHMKPRNGGRIIVTTSISAAKTELHVGTPYVAAKAGSAQLVRQAAHELARYDILVNAIAPGPITTNISGGRLQDPAVQASFARLHPMHRMGAPADIQGIAVFLASPASRFITGAQIVVDGGYSLGAAD